MIIDIDPIINKAFPAVTDKSWKYDDICYYAQSDVTCYVLRGEHGDILISSIETRTKMSMFNILLS